MRTVLPGFATMSEFCNLLGLTGDCGPTATLAALHEVDPVRWPLTPEGLKALDQDEISHGFAEKNGAQNIPAMDAYLSHLGVPHYTVGYAPFTFARYHADLKALSGKQPIITEWALAGKLPGDEAGVHFHFSTDGGIDLGPRGDGVGGGYLWCDGDNRADDGSGRTRPAILYTIQQIAAAQPIAYVVITAPLHLAGWSDDGVTLTALGPNGRTVQFAFRDYLLTHAWNAANVATSGDFGDRGGNTQRFTINQLHWDGQSVT
ncbi:MAG: hypothetical protein ACRDHP_06320, partial [Ktedonobacterales bacterium]